MGPNPGGASLCLGAILAEQGQRRVTGRLQPNGSAYPGDVSEEGGRHASEWVAGEGRLASAVYWRRKGHEHPAAGAAQAGRCRFLRRARMPPDLGHLPPPPPEPRRSLLQSYSPGHGRTVAFRGECVNLHHLSPRFVFCLAVCIVCWRDAFVHSSPARGKNVFAIAVGLSLRVGCLHGP
jgi:hypothetical protein